MVNGRIEDNSPINPLRYAFFVNGGNPYGETGLNSCFGNGYASNPLSRNGQIDELLEKLVDVKDPQLKQNLLDGLYGKNPSRAFVDMLIKRYEKKQAEFEVAWAEYQASKDNLAFYKKTFEILEKKYEGSESDYENGLVRHADKDLANAETTSDILLDIASSIAHRLT